MALSSGHSGKYFTGKENHTGNHEMSEENMPPVVMIIQVYGLKAGCQETGSI
jgi:hypothetical protein